MHEINTSQRQVQEQKTTVKGGGIGSWIGEVIKWGLFLTGCLVGIGVLLWVFDGSTGQYIDLGVLFVFATALLWWLYNWGKRQHYSTQAAERDTHFFVHPHMVIGDETTREYIPFFIPQFPEPETVRDEPMQIEESIPVDTSHATGILNVSQAQEGRIQDMYWKDEMTMNDIVKHFKDNPLFDSVTLYDVRKALGKTGKEPKE